MASAAEQLAANLNFGAFQKATELQKRIGFTLIALVIYRLGTYIPVPGIDPVKFAASFAGQSQGIVGMFNMFSGGAVERMAIFALNVMPYISASIIVQLLGTVYPPWEKLKKEGGEAGRKTLNQYTRYLTVVLALVQAASIAFGMISQGVVLPGIPPLFFAASTIVTLTGGTLFLMWLGEQITSRGVGNGISLIIFAGIVAVLPRSIWQLLQQAQVGSVQTWQIFALGFVAIAVVLFIVFMERSQRRLLIQYPKQQRGNRMVGGESSFLPLKINTSGVIPPIFASSLLLLPMTAASFMNPATTPGWLQWMLTALQHGQPLFMLFYGGLIIFFCFFYTSVVFNPDDTAENLRKYGGFLPGIRPGKRTAEYLDFVLTRLTVIGAAYIAAVCLLPEFMVSVMNAPASARALGGTSILIVVSVTMDTVAQIQSHLLAHQYEGLIKKSKLRGGRK
ncbi:MAG: preprotein translocase subunit SecY [Caulobacter sp.]|nr:preprotein translocase subunit SecY [Caulobacter sp.]